MTLSNEQLTKHAARIETDDFIETIRRAAYEAGKQSGISLGWQLRRLAELTGDNFTEALAKLEKMT